MALSPPRWQPDELASDCARAEEEFRAERLDEPLEKYLEFFDRYAETFAKVLSKTENLDRLRETAIELLAVPSDREAIRYLAGPIISEDDLKTLAEAGFSAQRVRTDPEMVTRVVETISRALDRRRFGWIGEKRAPTDEERKAAILATAALMANSRAATVRRNRGKELQERLVLETLERAGFKQVPRRGIETLRAAPEVGHFCRESVLAGRKADLIVTLWDGRVMPIECKVSNSAVNSFKRLNHEAASKAEAWIKDLGAVQIVPTAVIGGVFSLRNVLDAQQRGLTIFWAHRLDALVQWLSALTRRSDEGR